MPVKGDSKYNLDICIEICRRHANGENIKEILKSNPKIYPHYSTWCEWVVEHKDLSDLYTRAREGKSHSTVSEIDEILNKLLSGKIDAQTAKVLIDALKWRAGKESRNLYGEGSKVDVTSGGDKIDNTIVIKHVDMSKPE